MNTKMKLRVRRVTSKQAGVLGHPATVATPQVRRQVVARRIGRRKSQHNPADASVSAEVASARVVAGATRLTHTESAEREEDIRPLEFGLIRRVFTYMRPHSAKRNWLLLAVLVRSLQLPALAALLSYVINGPLVNRDIRGTLMGALGFLLLAAVTQVTLHFRSKLALELGEAVVHDLRRDVFAHLQKMTMSFYHKTPVGSIISRMTSDIEVIRALVQDVLFVSLVGLG